MSVAGYGFNKKLDDEDKEMDYLKYEFVYGTYDFSQIIWDILYNYIVSLHHKCFGVSSVIRCILRLL